MAHGAPSRQRTVNLSAPARAQKFVDGHHPASGVRPFQLRLPWWEVMTLLLFEWAEHVATKDAGDSVDDVAIRHLPEGPFAFEKASRPGDGRLANHGSLQSLQ